MEIHQQMIPPNLVYPGHSSDDKYFNGLSTVMVAKIQETKDGIQDFNDRLSQIEYIFCSQLYPNFQQTKQEMYSEARQHAELAFREKENNLLLQISELHSEKQRLLEENHLMSLERAKFTNMESELRQKSVEVNKVMEELQKLQKLLDSKAADHEKVLDKLKSLEVEYVELRAELVNKSRELDGLKKHVEKENGVINKLEIMQKKFDELQSALREKCEEVDKGKGLHGNLLKKIEFLDSEVKHNEQRLNKRDMENKLLAERIMKLDYSAVELRNELDRKNSELEEGRKVQEQLQKQIDSSNIVFAEYGQEKKMLLGKQRDLEEKIDKLQRSLDERSNESSELMELNEKLKQLMEAKDLKLKSAYRQFHERYKNLKSQYNSLRERYGLTPETATPYKKIEDVNEEIITDPCPVSSKGVNHKSSKSIFLENEVLKPECKQDILEDNKENIPRPNPVSSHVSNVLISAKHPASTKSSLPAGTKRPASHWRDTRSHQSRVGPDLHDDFLDTPLENARGNMSKVMKKQQDLDNINFEDSDDETQDMNVDPGPGLKQATISKPGSSGFKYVEPVRKKLERDNLKGVECKQCKKFYDAVLPETEEKGDGNKQNVRCEHHEGVSRHRYRYAPPLTPEGFWNIGFESEM